MLSSSIHCSIARVKLHFCFSWMKAASLHHVYTSLGPQLKFQCWCKWFTCGLSRGVQTLDTEKFNGEKIILANTCQWGGFPKASSSSLLGKNSEEKFWGRLLVHLLQLNASLSCVTEFTWWKNAVMLKSGTPLWLQWNKSIFEAKGCVLATVSLTFTCCNQFLSIEFLPQFLLLRSSPTYLVFIYNCFLEGCQQFRYVTWWKLQ